MTSSIAQRYRFYVNNKQTLRNIKLYKNSEVDWRGKEVSIEREPQTIKEKIKHLSQSRLFACFFFFFVALVFGTIVFGITEKLSFLDSLYFSATTLCTIGFGDIEPKSSVGLVFIILFLFGILFLKIYTICSISLRNYELKKRNALLLTPIDRKKLRFFGVFKVQDDYNKVILLAFLFLLFVIIGSVIFSYIEEWTFNESLYFMTITLTTIGFGDIVVKRAGGKILIIAFALAFLYIKFYLLHLIGRRNARKEYVAKLKNKKILEEKMYEPETTEKDPELSEIDSFAGTQLVPKRKPNVCIRLYSTFSDLPTRLKLSMGIFTTIVFILLGGVLFTQTEDWDYIDSIYFVVVVICTIGYGDLTVKGEFQKIILILYAFMGLYIMSNIILSIEKSAAENAKQVLTEKKKMLVPMRSKSNNNVSYQSINNVYENQKEDD
eukprot:TRINITY_DN4826_c0_g1_i1.p1 TRINITY_DN4826_c0_g1~~TRINITY_DN4826_c0_g1_i1.p1  ORF type:complete len:436 (+),score=91.33 TRINITY_DN4826_c0_g1_i1:184-1491(+)